MANMSTEETFKFLELYQAENCLWNPKNKYHKNKNVINDSWKRIADTMGIPVHELKKKKDNLLSTFRTNLKKRNASIRSGAGTEDVYQPIWIFYDVMAAFLTDVYESTSILNTEEKISASSEGATTHRHAMLEAGLPVGTPVLGVNKLCGSGMQAVVNSAQDIMTGTARVSLAAGTESMSMVPFLVRNIRFTTELREPTRFEDLLVSGSLDTYCGFTMAQTAENLAEMYGLKREELDEYAYTSQRKWKAGYERGAFVDELAPIKVDIEGQEVVVEKDEHPRPNTTLEHLGSMPAIFKPGGVGTVGNSTGVSNGAGAILLASEEAVSTLGLRPLARLVGWACAGVEPALMGLGPVPAVRSLLDAARGRLQDVDMIEINEPFSGQALASAIELDVDRGKMNVDGGAIALGHPPAASGARIVAHLAHQLRRRGLRRGIGTTCIGGGQGIALLLEAV